MLPKSKKIRALNRPNFSLCYVILSLYALQEAMFRVLPFGPEGLFGCRPNFTTATDPAPYFMNA